MNENEKQRRDALIIAGIVIVMVIAGLWFFTRRSRVRTELAEKLPKVIKVPKSFGAPLSVGGGDYRMLILFEHGMIVTYHPSGEYVFEYVDGS